MSPGSLQKHDRHGHAIASGRGARRKRPLHRRRVIRPRGFLPAKLPGSAAGDSAARGMRSPSRNAVDRLVRSRVDFAAPAQAGVYVDCRSSSGHIDQSTGTGR